MSILIVSYYGMKEPFNSICQSFENNQYKVSIYPLFQYYADIHDKKEDYLDHFNKYIHDVDPDVILWWYIGIPVEGVEYIKNKNLNRLHIFYNWDDPYSWDRVCDTGMDMKSKFLDVAFTSCEDSVGKYIDNGSKYSYCLYPGYNPDINYPVSDEKYEYDVSFIITNLYNNNNYDDQYLPRLEFINTLYNDKSIKFGLFGPPYLGKLYPDSYVSHLSYTELNGVFNKSRINVSLHVCNSKSNYLNERTVLIWGSGCLLLTDLVKDNEDLTINGDNCVIINKDTYMSQIKGILQNYGSYDTVKKNGYKFSKKYVWDEWAHNIHEKIKNLYKPKKKAMLFDNIGVNISRDEWIEIMYIFKRIKKCDIGLEEGLVEMTDFVVNNPYVNINKLLDQYLKIDKLN